MSIYMTLEQSDSMVDVPSSSICGEALVGSNGDIYGVPGYDISDGGDDSYGYITWVADPNQAFNTGNVAFQMEVNLGTGEESLQVGDQPAVTLSEAGGRSVDVVELRAGAQITGQAGWGGVTVNFYQGDTLQESAVLSQGPQVDTTESNSNSAEQIMRLVPSSNNNDRVVISGVFNLSTPSGIVPSPQDLFCQACVIPTAA